MKKLNILFAPTLAVLTISALIGFSSCEKESLVTCDGECSSSSPYSNSYSDYCYSTKSGCQEKTGHTCKKCD